MVADSFRSAGHATDRASTQKTYFLSSSFSVQIIHAPDGLMINFVTFRPTVTDASQKSTDKWEIKFETK
jgi:hypothetical protein